MDSDKAKDVGATAVGGMSGLDMLYTGIQGMLEGGADGPEIKLVFYGLVSIVMGFFAFRKDQVAKPASVIAPLLAAFMLFGLTACASDKKATIRGDMTQAFVEGCADLPLAIATAQIADTYVKDKDLTTGIEVAKDVDALCDIVLRAQSRPPQPTKVEEVKPMEEDSYFSPLFFWKD